MAFGAGATTPPGAAACAAGADAGAGSVVGGVDGAPATAWNNETNNTPIIEPLLNAV
ncbi:MAG: hypothetical protein IV086_13975 [Hyphomonadaceae bacterium]|nr:hypothetical protein [Hyphomonadaceae bacterium]